MFPLLVKDGQVVSFIALSCCFLGITKLLVDNVKTTGKLQGLNFIKVLYKINRSKEEKFIENLAIFSYTLSTLAQVALIIGYLFVPPPSKLPFLHPLLISAFSCFHFVGFFIYFNVKQIFYE
jgi:alpha-1,3-glucosyltransferase